MKVKLHFMLSGKTDEWKRRVHKDLHSQLTNEDVLNFVKDATKEQFGNRPIKVIEEVKLSNNSYPYPKFYSAGWFVSIGEKGISELVVINHGNSINEANKNMIESVKTIDWNNYSSKVEHA